MSVSASHQTLEASMGPALTPISVVDVTSIGDELPDHFEDLDEFVEVVAHRGSAATCAAEASAVITLPHTPTCVDASLANRWTEP